MVEMLSGHILLLNMYNVYLAGLLSILLWIFCHYLMNYL